MEGVSAEAGVYRGGSAFILHHAAPEKPLYLFDSFQGLPAPLPFEEEQLRKGDFSATLEDVRALLPSAILIKGWFHDTLNEYAHLRFSFVHLDCDLYQSLKETLAFFYPRLSPGGVILCDDYAFPSTPGARLAIDQATLPSAPLSTNQLVIWRPKVV